MKSISKFFSLSVLMTICLFIGFSSCDEDEAVDICDCSIIYLPVCANGELFINECIAVCNGVSPDDFQTCDPSQIDSVAYSPCIVTFENSPICAGGITYGNPSIASCAGWMEYTEGACADQGCICPEIYDPVCVATPGGGTILTFSNACFAECEGYDENIYYPCDPQPTNCPNGTYGEVLNFAGLDGCGLVIESPLHGTLEPVIIDSNIPPLEEGMNINFEFIFRDDFASICMVGPIVEITCYDVL